MKSDLTCLMGEWFRVDSFYFLCDRITFCYSLGPFVYFINGLPSYSWRVLYFQQNVIETEMIRLCHI